MAHTDDLLDTADQHVGEVDRMAENVRRHAVAGLVEHEAPREQTHRIGAVHRKEATSVVGDLAEFTSVDQLLGVLHQRRPSVVVSDTCDHTGRPRGGFDANGLFGCATHRLLAEHMLARFGGSDRNRLVQHVRRADHDDVDVVVGDQVVPVDGAVTKAEVGDGLIDPRRHVVADHHQFGVELALGKQGRDSQD